MGKWVIQDTCLSQNDYSTRWRQYSVYILLQEQKKKTKQQKGMKGYELRYAAPRRLKL